MSFDSELHQDNVPSYSRVWFGPSNFKILDHLKHSDNIMFLEIGSFEGYSANYFVEHFLSGNNSKITCIDPWIKYSESTVTKMPDWDKLINESTYDIFIRNTKSNSDKIIIKRGLSKDILPSLKSEYDFIYVDGDHSEKAVWIDATLSFEILKVGGIMIFDDYEWNVGDKSPKDAVDRFLNEYSDKVEVLFVNQQVGIRKTSN